MPSFEDLMKAVCFNLKTISKRCDIIVLGAGLTGITAALCAARAGSTVTLLEARPFLGGRIGKEIKFLYDFKGTTNFAYQRETGLLDEILTSIFVENEEGKLYWTRQSFI